MKTLLFLVILVCLASCSTANVGAVPVPRAASASDSISITFYDGIYPAVGYDVTLETNESWVPPCVMTGHTDAYGFVLFENVPATVCTITILDAQGQPINAWNREWGGYIWGIR